MVERRGVLYGYELYLVEQWACSRLSPTLVIVSYTGNEKHFVVVGVLAIPEDESVWSKKLSFYLKATQQYHARPKYTELGELMVTNLSSFPSALTVIPVPDGDIKNHRLVFAVNENLKRLGCSGRSGLTLTDPTQTTQAKFRSLYKTSDKIPFFQSVTELIKLCQVALCLFEMLDYEYVDGLLCDVTEAALGNWWTEVGAEHYNFEPTDGILGPTTVAALLGMLMGSRNRLNWYGAPVTKDVFEIEGTKRGISYFQKAQKLEKTRRFDRQTLFRLHTVTAKAAAGEGWGVQKAVKSTVTEIGGKRGEIVMGMVSGKDKGGLADIETLDIDKFISLAYGERPKWLWHGKPRRTQIEQLSLDTSVPTTPGKDGQLAPPKKIQSLPLEDELEARRRQETAEGIQRASVDTYSQGLIDSANNSVDRDALRKGVFKSVAGKMSDAKSGLGRIKDAVGGSRRGHSRGISTTFSAKEDWADSATASSIPSSSLDPAMSSDPAMVSRAFTWKNKPEEYLAAMRRGEDTLAPGYIKDQVHSSDPSTSDQDSQSGRRPRKESPQAQEKSGKAPSIAEELRQNISKHVPASIRSDVDATDHQVPVSDAEQHSDVKPLVLHRRFSMSDADRGYSHLLNENRWPRRTSFSDAEEAVLGWDEIVDINETRDELSHLKALSEVATQMKERVDDILYDVEPWVEEKVNLVNSLNERYSNDKENIQNIYVQLSEACQRVRTQADEMLAEERAHLMENTKEIEVFVARLDYEINALVQRVQDVEDGVQNFERQVDDVEARAAELKAQLETESWLHWCVRTLTGIGTGPNITRTREK